MKRVSILRHGKSDWNADFDLDHDRPLAPRGIRASKRIGSFMSDARLVPDKAITSTAKRAQETLILAMESGQWNCAIEENSDLYLTSPEVILQVIQRQPDSIQHLLLVGHNPTSEKLAGFLVGGGSVRMPTAALAGVKLVVESWQEVERGKGLLDFLITPKLLKSCR
jgi:phosphohistidine phosphatase